jgi:hypothetical protein
MRRVLAWLVVCACGGASQSQLADTPTARTRPTPTEAPPASTSDQDRAHLVQQFDDMQATQNAQAEAKQGSAAPPPKKTGVKKGYRKAPVEQAPMPTKAPGQTPAQTQAPGQTPSQK